MPKVIRPFPERYDDNYAYVVGDIYPRDGWEPPEGRVKELMDGTNRAGMAFLYPEDEKPKKGRKPKETKEEE